MYMCKYFYDGVCECPDCMEGKTVINCRVVPNSLYNTVGDTFSSDLTHMDG